MVVGELKSVMGNRLMRAVYAGLDLGELSAALRRVDVGGYFAATVDNCGVVAVS